MTAILSTKHEHWFSFFGSKVCPECGEKFDLPIKPKPKLDNPLDSKDNSGGGDNE